MDDVVLIPYIEKEGGAAEVWIGHCKRESNDLLGQAWQALASFADINETEIGDVEGLQDHCEAWGADRILLPTDETPPRWTAYTIASVLLGKPVEV